MKSILVIGLGRFGEYFAKKASEIGNEVMVVDTDENLVNEIMPFVSGGFIGDCKSEHILKSIGVSNFDVCVVAIGENFQASLEITCLLKDNGAKYVMSKANSSIQKKFLERNGADEVLYIEKQAAERLAMRYCADNIFDYIPMTDQYSMFEIGVPKHWIGKTIEDMDVRNKYNMIILATKQYEVLSPMPGADYIFTGNEHLVVISDEPSIEKLI